MALKNLMVAVDVNPAAAARVDYAIALADRHQAHLTGLFVQAPPNVPGYVLAQIPPEARSAHDEATRDLEDRARERFDEAVRRSGATARAEWRSAAGHPTTVAALHARYCDLMLIGQSDPEAEAFSVPEPDAMVLMSGRPMLIVPYAFRVAEPGGHVVVAWNAGREAARAVADAMPILERADKVTVLSVNPDPYAMGDQPGADIALHLARHGIRAEAAHIRSKSVDPADALLSRVSDLGGDMIVMGGYGRTRLRELVLGGVTRKILHEMTVPVLMSH